MMEVALIGSGGGVGAAYLVGGGGEEGSSLGTKNPVSAPEPS